MTDWQPINTAPKDGTRILVCCFDMNNWEFDVSSWTTEEYEDDEGNIDEYTGWLPMVGVSGPTHWMPLPEPPVEGE